MAYEANFSIGELASRAGCKLETVRYYEKAGLMPEPPRSDGGHRMYGWGHLKRLNFIRRSRELGFTVAQVRELLSLMDEPDHTCGEVKAIALSQARETQRKIEHLKRLQRALTAMSVECRGGPYSVDDCPIIEALFDGTQQREIDTSAVP